MRPSFCVGRGYYLTGTARSWSYVLTTLYESRFFQTFLHCQKTTVPLSHSFNGYLFSNPWSFDRIRSLQWSVLPVSRIHSPMPARRARALWPQQRGRENYSRDFFQLPLHSMKVVDIEKPVPILIDAYVENIGQDRAYHAGEIKGSLLRRSSSMREVVKLNRPE